MYLTKKRAPFGEYKHIFFGLRYSELPPPKKKYIYIYVLFGNRVEVLLHGYVIKCVFSIGEGLYPFRERTPNSYSIEFYANKCRLCLHVLEGIDEKLLGIRVGSLLLNTEIWIRIQFKKKFGFGSKEFKAGVRSASLIRTRSILTWIHNIQGPHGNLALKENLSHTLKNKDIHQVR